MNLVPLGQQRNFKPCKVRVVSNRYVDHGGRLGGTEHQTDHASRGKSSRERVGHHDDAWPGHVSLQTHKTLSMILTEMATVLVGNIKQGQSDMVSTEGLARSQDHDDNSNSDRNQQLYSVSQLLLHWVGKISTGSRQASAKGSVGIILLRSHLVVVLDVLDQENTSGLIMESVGYILRWYSFTDTSGCQASFGKKCPFAESEIFDILQGSRLETILWMSVLHQKGIRSKYDVLDEICRAAVCDVPTQWSSSPHEFQRTLTDSCMSVEDHFIGVVGHTHTIDIETESRNDVELDIQTLSISCDQGDQIKLPQAWASNEDFQSIVDNSVAERLRSDSTTDIWCTPIIRGSENLYRCLKLDIRSSNEDDNNDIENITYVVSEYAGSMTSEGRKFGFDHCTPLQWKKWTATCELATSIGMPQHVHGDSQKVKFVGGMENGKFTPVEFSRVDSMSKVAELLNIDKKDKEDQPNTHSRPYWHNMYTHRKWYMESETVYVDWWKTFAMKCSDAKNIFIPSNVDSFQDKQSVKQPISILMTDASVSDKESGGTDRVWLEARCSLQEEFVEVYFLQEHCRRAFRTLVYTSDAKKSFHQLGTDNNKSANPNLGSWELIGGHWKPQVIQTQSSGNFSSWCAFGRRLSKSRLSTSLSIRRILDPQKAGQFNQEVYVPNRLLTGLLSDQILATFTFWCVDTGQRKCYANIRGCQRCIRGYPSAELIQIDPEWEDDVLGIHIQDYDICDVAKIERSKKPTVHRDAGSTAHKVEKQEQKLELINSPRATGKGGILNELYVTLENVEQAGQCLVWGFSGTRTQVEGADGASIVIMQLPRLPLQFQLQEHLEVETGHTEIAVGGGTRYLRMCSVDYPGYFVTSPVDFIKPLLPGDISDDTNLDEMVDIGEALDSNSRRVLLLLTTMKHALLLKNRAGERALLVPNYAIEYKCARNCFEVEYEVQVSESRDRKSVRLFMYRWHTTMAAFAEDEPTTAGTLYLAQFLLAHREFHTVRSILDPIMQEISASHLDPLKRMLQELTNGIHDPDAEAFLNYMKTGSRQAVETMKSKLRVSADFAPYLQGTTKEFQSKPKQLPCNLLYQFEAIVHNCWKYIQYDYGKLLLNPGYVLFGTSLGDLEKEYFTQRDLRFSDTTSGNLRELHWESNDLDIRQLIDLVMASGAALGGLLFPRLCDIILCKDSFRGTRNGQRVDDSLELLEFVLAVQLPKLVENGQLPQPQWSKKTGNSLSRGMCELVYLQLLYYAAHATKPTEWIFTRLPNPWKAEWGKRFLKHLRDKFEEARQNHTQWGL